MNQNITDWYKDNIDNYQTLESYVKSTLESLLKLNKIDYLTVNMRIKSLQSILQKFSRKNYSSMNELTDVLGARIILYLEYDIKKVNEIINEAFEVDKINSINKSEQLAIDQIGYRSTHHICKLGQARATLPELKLLKDIKFEVQVRTVLQHAWAEIEHDRKYKFPGDLPKNFARRLNLLSGTLELIDREFSSLAHDLDEYTNEESRRPDFDNDEEITSRSVDRMLEKIKGIKFEVVPVQIRDTLVDDELVRFGLKTIGDLKKHVTKEFIESMNKHEPESNTIGFLRNVMMFSDLKMYFEKAFRYGWQGIEENEIKFLTTKYSISEVMNYLEAYEIEVE